MCCTQWTLVSDGHCVQLCQPTKNSLCHVSMPLKRCRPLLKLWFLSLINPHGIRTDTSTCSRGITSPLRDPHIDGRPSVRLTEPVVGCVPVWGWALERAGRSSPPTPGVRPPPLCELESPSTAAFLGRYALTPACRSDVSELYRIKNNNKKNASRAMLC